MTLQPHRNRQKSFFLHNHSLHNFQIHCIWEMNSNSFQDETWSNLIHCFFTSLCIHNLGFVN